MAGHTEKPQLSTKGENVLTNSVLQGAIWRGHAGPGCHTVAWEGRRPRPSGAGLTRGLGEVGAVRPRVLRTRENMQHKNDFFSKPEMVGGGSDAEDGGP